MPLNSLREIYISFANMYSPGRKKRDEENGEGMNGDGGAIGQKNEDKIRGSKRTNETHAHPSHPKKSNFFHFGGRGRGEVVRSMKSKLAAKSSR